jgi:AraC family transcriptional regulator
MKMQNSSLDLAFGTTGHCLVNGFSFSECTYDPECRIPAHAHQEGRFCLVLEGVFTEQVGHQSREGSPHQLSFLASHEVHSAIVSPQGGRCFNIEICPTMMERARQHAVILDTSAQYHNPALLQLSKRLYHEFQIMDAVAPLTLEGLALELLAMATRHPIRDAERSAPHWLRQAKALLHEAYLQNLSMEQIALTVGIHPTHLARAFRQHYHCTVGDYIRTLRIEHARYRLATSDASLGEIAIEAGFADQSHFSRVFKRHTHVTPAEFRRICR